MIERLKLNVKNKSWWVAVISLIILLAQRFGLNLTDYIGSDWQNTLNTIFSLAVLFGISVDTTMVNTSNSTENEIQEKSTDTNTSVSDSSNSDNSASAKIVVDNPDNTVAIGQEVNAVSAAKPQ